MSPKFVGFSYCLSEVLRTLFIFYKNLVYKNIKAWDRSKIKNIVVILLVAIFISFEPQDEI